MVDKYKECDRAKNQHARGFHIPWSGMVGYRLYPGPKAVLQETDYVSLIHLVPRPW